MWLTNDLRTRSDTHLGGCDRKSLTSYLKSASRRLEANQKSIIAGDFDINQFLQQVKQEDLKWGFKQLSDNQIEGKDS